MKKSLKSSLLGIIITSAFTPAISIAQDFDWSGFYLGGSAGSAKNDSDWKGSGDFNSDTSGLGVNASFNLGDFTRELSDSSSIYGLYAGYNFQKNNIVYGVELDYSTLSGSKDVQLDGGEGAVLGAG
jgi:opacity protein-like surface antigen